METTALVILNYNNAADTEACLQSILRYNTAPVRFIVVDNDSRPEEREALSAAMDRAFGLGGWTLVEHPRGTAESLAADPASSAAAPVTLPSATLVETNANIGYGKGNNAGLALAYADPVVTHVMILNNDILFTEDIIPGLLSGLRDLDKCAIISPVLYKLGLEEYDHNCARRCPTVANLIGHNMLHYLRVLRHRTNQDVHPGQYLLLGGRPDGDYLEIELPSGSCMLAAKDFFREIGSFDPGTFMYFEENILQRKIADRGMRNYLSLNHRCIHLGASTTTRVADNKWLVQQAIDSEVYYVRRYSGASLPARWAHRASIAFYRLTYLLSKSLKK